MKRKIAALLLCISMLIPLSMPLFAAEIGSAAILSNGIEETDLTITPDEKAELLASFSRSVPLTYQWQILTDVSGDEMWVNIYGENADICAVSYALVANALKGGQAKIRCALTADRGIVFTDPVTIHISQSPSHPSSGTTQETAPKPTQAEDPEMVPETIQATSPQSTSQEAAEPAAEATASLQVQAKAPAVSSDSSAVLDEDIKAPRDLDMRTVSICYVYEDGSEAYSSYVAAIAAGTDFSATVISPQIVGFKPEFEDGTAADQVLLSYTGVTENRTIFVYYHPQPVRYLIEHHQQNVMNDDYIIFETMQKTGRVNGLTETEARQYEGFYSLPYEDISIAADGSTVVEIYYDRLYYLMTFKLDGGYGVEPIYARYGTAVSVIKPTKAGYTFEGWRPIAQDENGEFLKNSDGTYVVGDLLTALPETIPAKRSGYVAQWSAAQASYTVVFWAENADDDDYSFWGYRTVSAPAGQRVSVDTSLSGATGVENDAQYFTYNAALSDQDIIVKGDGSAIANVYYSRNRYSILFYIEGGSDYICGFDNHTHTYDRSETVYVGGCYPMDGSTVPECGLEAHAHTQSCIVICGLEAHTHSPAVCCGKEVHSHVRGCYTGLSNTTAGGNTLNTLNAQNPDKANGTIAFYNNNYYVYLGTDWYRGSTRNQSPVLSCGKEQHAHSQNYKDNTEGCNLANCEKAEHTHTAACYSCGKEVHTHTYDRTATKYYGGCYPAEGALTCSIPEHIHNRNCATGTFFRKITAKYNQYIGDLWPTSADVDPEFKDTEGAFYAWSISTGSGTTTQASKILNMVPSYCNTNSAQNHTYRAKAQFGGNILNHLYYMFESFDQTSPEYGNKRKLYNGTYYDLAPDYYQDISSSSYSWSAKNIFGMTNTGYNYQKLSSTEYDQFFYYSRNEYRLNYYNYNASMWDGSVKCGADISAGNIPPPYPSVLEENAFEFKGWYTTPNCIPGSEFSFEGAIMPSKNLSLYANWIPKIFNVQYYRTAQLDDPLKDAPIQVTFGSKLQEMPIPENPYENVSFIGWYYMDNGVERAIDFEEFTVKKDLDIYAKWSSAANVLYSVKYQIATGQAGAGTEIAASIQGYTKAGNNRTFMAKTGISLYPDYQQGYYPVTNSHTILMDPTQENTYVFEYVYRESTQYTVRYLDRETSIPLAPDKLVENNKNAVVTENYLFIKDYVADAFQKRLTVTGSDADNVITFWYTKSENNKLAPYTVTHYVQDAEIPTAYTAYQTLSLQGTVGETRATTVLNLDGYAFDPSQILVGYYDTNGDFHKLSYTYSGQAITLTLPQMGAQIDLYYNCVSYPYEIRHINYETGLPITNSETGTAPYGKTITRSALTAEELAALQIPYYTVHGSGQQTRRIAIETESTAKNNVITFYYMEKQLTYHYIPVVKPSGYTNYGSVSVKSNTVKVFSGVAGGSVPVESTGFSFQGWYLDPDCTLPVSDSEIYKTYLQADHALIPQKNAQGVYASAQAADDRIVFYALFTPNTADLTIVKTGAQDAGQVFVYRLTGSYGLSMEVTITGNGSVTIHDLPFGTYTVTEENSWSWRYKQQENVSQETTLEQGGASLTFTSGTEAPYWLDGHSSIVKNVFQAPQEKEDDET